MALKAEYVLKRNIEALLKERGQTQEELSKSVGASKSWLSQVLTKEKRGMRIAYLGEIADFFGLETYQLFLPGISDLTERRKGGERRSGADRRFQSVEEMRAPVPSLAELDGLIRKLNPEEYRKFAHRVQAALTVGELPLPSVTLRGRPAGDAPPVKRVKRSRGG